ncbi:MAG: NUDIX domain-containing protein [Phycisphaerae bacterium]|nr:NUDIX domain-containing protein [Phycisphaerae bacterium]
MLNPQLTYCPACGTRGLLHTAKHVQCPACDLELYFNPGTAVCALILNPQGEILVTIRAHDPKQGAWDLPGGFVDPGETAEQAMIREAQEELGVAIQDLKYLGSASNLLYHYKGITYQTTDLAFACTVEHPERIQAADDVQHSLWVAPENMDLTLFGFDSIRQIVARYLDNRPSPCP